MYPLLFFFYCRHARQEPGTAEPFIAHPFDLTNFHGFLILMSDGLYEAYESWTGRPETVNEDIAQLVAKEMRASTEFHFVAQKVVENVKYKFQQSCQKEKHTGRMDDITLIIRNFGYSDLPVGTAYSGIPSTAPVVSGQKSVFFSEQQRPPVSYYSSQSVSPPPNQQYQDYTASLPRGYDSRQQPPYPTSPVQQYPGNTGGVSMGGGAFVPEPLPSNSSDYHRQMGQHNVPPSGGYVQTNDWPGYNYSQQRPPPNDQPQQQHHSHATLTSVASFPQISQPAPKSRHPSVPAVTFAAQNLGSGQASPANHEYTRSRDYGNETNPLGTDQSQSDLSTSRSTLYENVSLRTQEMPSSDLKRYSNSSLEQQTQAMSVQDTTPPKQTVDTTLRKTTSGVNEPNTPPVSSSSRAAKTSTSSAVDKQIRPDSLQRTDSDFELYGWRIEDTSGSSLNEGSVDTPTQEKGRQYDTLQENRPPVTEVMGTPKITPPLENKVTTPTVPRATGEYCILIFY